MKPNYPLLIADLICIFLMLGFMYWGIKKEREYLDDDVEDRLCGV